MTLAAAPVGRALTTTSEVLTWAPEDAPRIQTLLALRRHWMTTLFCRVRRDYDKAIAGKALPTTMGEAEPIVLGLASTRQFLWLDRYIQNRLWTEVDRIVTPRLGEIEDLLTPRADDLGTLDEADEFTYPGYYTGIDFHRQAGGIWRDIKGAAMYAVGARVIHVGKNDNFELHERFTADIPDNKPTRILDLGAGFGKTTFSLKKRWADAEVHGIDLSAPCLKLGRRMATERGHDIHWRQADAEFLPDADESCDMVVITMVLHELPLASVAAVVREAYRVLRPGGILATLENRLIGDVLRDLLFVYHSDQIDEPYWQPFRDSDFAGTCRDAGFDAEARNWYRMGTTAEMEADPMNWATPWSLMTARKG